MARILLAAIIAGCAGASTPSAEPSMISPTAGPGLNSVGRTTSVDGSAVGAGAHDDGGSVARIPSEPTVRANDPPIVGPSPTTVIASWYGPGFYGNRTACGQTYTPQIMGVAHKTLPCGTLVTLAYGERRVTVPVIDRGPFIAGREFDLSNAARAALACSDLCRVQWHR